MGRKIVFIPVISLSGPGGHTCRLVIESGGRGGMGGPVAGNLRFKGLGGLVEQVQNTLARAGLPSAHGLPPARPPVIDLIGSPANLSNLSGIALGLALGLLMYDRRCPWREIIAIGTLALPDPDRPVIIKPNDLLARHLAAVSSLGQQSRPLPFLVPDRIGQDTWTRDFCREEIAALGKLNIIVLPAASLEEALAACWRLKHHQKS